MIRFAIVGCGRIAQRHARLGHRLQHRIRIPQRRLQHRPSIDAARSKESRQRLLDAAFKLMAERGMDGVVINEITEAADVGFGSFYNHFESRDAIYNALMQPDRLLDDVTHDLAADTQTRAATAEATG